MSIDLTSREIASIFWMSIIIIWMARHEGVRREAREVIKAFFQIKVIFVVALSYLYVALFVFILHKVKLWSVDNLKTTLVWVVFNTLGAIAKLTSAKDYEKYFISYLRDIFKFAGVIVFICELHSFSLSVELIAVPIVTFLSLLHVVAGISHKNEAIEKFLTWAMAFVSLFYVFSSVYITWLDMEAFVTLTTMREFLVPMFLALGFVPFLYVLSVFIVYESSFLKIQFFLKNEQLCRIAKSKCLIAFGFNIRCLKILVQYIVRFRPKNEKELDVLFDEVQDYAKREVVRELIPRKQGWSPFVIKDYLKNEGLAIDSYDRISDVEWSGCSNYYKIDNNNSSGHIIYIINGNKLAVTEVSLRLTVYDINVNEQAMLEFSNLSIFLLSKIVDSKFQIRLQNRIIKQNNFNFVSNFEIIKYDYKKYGLGNGEYRVYTLTVISRYNNSK